jgi:hypothetical protein
MNNNQEKTKKNKSCLIYFLAVSFLFLAVLFSLVSIGGYFAWKRLDDLRTIKITETLVNEFHDYTEKIKKVSHLQLAVRKTKETLKRSVSKSYKIPLKDKPIEGSASVEIRCPVTYFYYVDMKGKWSFSLKNGILNVRAPKLQVGEPAIDSSLLEKKTESGWLVFGENAMMEELERDLTPEFRKRAVSAGHLEIVRENCRKSLEDFVKAWLCQGNYDVDEVNVVFEDEELAAGKDSPRL